MEDKTRKSGQAPAEIASDGWISFEIGKLNPEHDPWERNQFRALKELQRLRAASKDEGSLARHYEAQLVTNGPCYECGLYGFEGYHTKECKAGKALFAVLGEEAYGGQIPT